MKTIGTILLFQLAWFGCVSLSGTMPSLAVIPMTVWMVIALSLSPDKTLDVKLMMAITSLGFIVDTLFIQMSILKMDAAFSPPWLVSLWLGFSLTIRWAYTAIEHSRVLSMVLGGLAGALSYRGGAHLGGIQLADPEWYSVGCIGLCWSIIFPLCIGLHHRWKRPQGAYPVEELQMNIGQ